MNKAAIKYAAGQGRPAKKLESIDKRLRKLLDDMEAQGLALDMTHAQGRHRLCILVRHEDGTSTLIASYDAP